VSRSVHEGFAERLHLALDEAGYGASTQKDLGRLFGVSAQAVKKWLSGDAIPSAERAPTVAQKLGVRRAWLLDNEQPMRALTGAITEAGHGYSAEQGISLSGAEFGLLTQYRQLPRQLQIGIANLIADFNKSRDSRK
jgi:transcriptional regulator with XRE-family HTH domain